MFVREQVKLWQRIKGTKDDEEATECAVCERIVYPVDKVKMDKKVFHRQCFKCSKCLKGLSVQNYYTHEGLLYCKTHMQQIFHPELGITDAAAAPPLITTGGTNTEKTLHKSADQFQREFAFTNFKSNKMFILAVRKTREQFQKGIPFQELTSSDNVDKEDIKFAGKFKTLTYSFRCSELSNVKDKFEKGELLDKNVKKTEVEARCAELGNIKAAFEQPTSDESEKQKEAKKLEISEEFQKIKKEKRRLQEKERRETEEELRNQPEVKQKSRTALTEELQEEEKPPEDSKIEDLAITAEHAQKMRAKWEKIQRKEAKKAMNTKFRRLNRKTGRYCEMF
ncbi:unnamed protein product [Soboliphyme baturini]|uniref:LIM zinc-binding domain-containing protein n=1 Tax=Soboliphyme baturini TaxID=241478 RepID=A0A183ITS2_9BILA|nr:unnamed protein product [Soboliphyme baturini]